MSGLRQLDFSAFAAPQHPRTRRVRVVGWLSGPSTRLVVGCLAAFVLGLPLLFFSGLIANTSGAPVLGQVYLVMWVVVLLGVPAIAVIDTMSSRNRILPVDSTSAQVQRFALHNDFSFTPKGAFGDAPSIFLDERGVRHTVDVVSGEYGLPFRLGSIGNYGVDRGDTVFAGGGFLSIRMERTLPHLYLVPMSTGAGDTELERFGFERRVLELEGDFGSRFALHVAPGYETDALYILTPDVMAALVDDAGDLFVETDGRWLTVFSVEPFVGKGEQLYRRLFGILETVGRQAHKQSVNYRDTRVVPPARVTLGQIGDNLRPFAIVGVALAASILVPWIAYTLLR